MSAPNQDLLLELRGVSKRYGNVLALDAADLALHAGQTLVLMGANGSGKSTLSKVVVGAVRPDSGTIVLDGRPYHPAGPAAARRAGIAVVYQELSLIPTLTVAQNIELGGDRGRKLFVDSAESQATAARLIERFAGVLDATGCRPDSVVADLPPDEQQIVEILKALYRRPRLLILDEATASLRGPQVERVFELVAELKREGAAIVFISHRMEEVYRVGDRATVLRNGRTVGSYELAATPQEELLHAMVGHHVVSAGANAPQLGAAAEPVLTVDRLRAPGVNDVSFRLAPGEVLGLGGLQGQGQSEVLRALFGATQRPPEGAVLVAGKPLTPEHPAQAIAAGIAMITGDRKRFGIFGTRSILENLTLAALLRRRGVLGVFRLTTLRSWVAAVVRRLAIKFAGLGARISSLSGGNQQKVIIGRWLLTEPKILLLDDPTKGVDIKTKTELYALVAQMCSSGVAVLWSSSEDHELLETAHRVLVLHEGRVTAELKGEQLNAYELYKAAL